MMLGYGLLLGSKSGVLRASLLVGVLALASCDRYDHKNASAQSRIAVHEPASPQGDKLGDGGGEAPAPAPPKPRPAPPVEPEPAPEPPPPAVPAGLRVVVLSTRSAKVSWVTPLMSDTELRWGTSAALERTPILQPAAVVNHCVLLDKLEPGTLYNVQGVSRSAQGATLETEVASFVTLEKEDYTVRTGHPRIFFNSDDLPQIRQRLSTTHAKAWADLRSTCEASLAKSNATIADGGSSSAYARAFAFAGLFSGDSRFKKKAQDIALECCNLGASGEKMDVRLRAMGVSAVYDWLHADLPDAVRAKLRSGMLEMYARLEADSNDHEFVWGHSHGNHRPMVLVALALFGEDRTATANLATLLGNYRDGFFATWRNYCDEGGSLKGWWYTTWTLAMEVEVLAAVRSATSVNWFQTESWYGRLVEWYLMGLRGDGGFTESGDTRPNYRWGQSEWIYALSVSHFYRDGKAKWLAHRVSSSEKIWSLYNIFSILWDDPDVAAEPPSGGLVRLYQTPGHVLLRSSWDAGAVLADFRSASDYTRGHTHLDNNSFTITYHAGLALDSGLYDEFGSSHHLNYSTRSVAHNTILVLDPAEKFYSGGREYANDGGQRWFGTSDGLLRSFPARAEETLDPQNGFGRGGFVLFQDAADFTYALGDAAPSYAPTKVKRFDRSFLWLKTVAGRTTPVIVIFDAVVARSEAFKKTYLLHTANRPTVAGALVTAENGGGILFQTTHFPANASISTVGGPGKEFVVGGVNYTPVRGPAPTDEAGAWRVEISPARPSTSDVFLNVLAPGDAGSSTPPATQPLQATGAFGCTVENWTLMFGERRTGLEELTYTTSPASPNHVVLGLAPNALYEISLDKHVTGSMPASSKGVLRFDAPGASEIHLVRRTAPAMNPVPAAEQPAPPADPPAAEPVAPANPDVASAPPEDAVAPPEDGGGGSVDPAGATDPLPTESAAVEAEESLPPTQSISLEGASQ